MGKSCGKIHCTNPCKITNAKRSSLLAMCADCLDRLLSKKPILQHRNILERFITELTHRIIDEAVKESLMSAGEITLYRFYHVFKQASSQDHIHTVFKNFIPRDLFKTQFLFLNCYKQICGRFQGELESLIAMVPSLRLLTLSYEHAYWWAVAEKLV
ncbi:unnamed protein product [Gongylonema pulchrum]|uniref:Histone domain-containing protein n=1 Tax=Gongylonema pulchrum TaxID=637853 RepID=A0A183DP11_9BILA|nr:unnamed protein product [Gongylonema pulchrum]